MRPSQLGWFWRIYKDFSYMILCEQIILIIPLKDYWGDRSIIQSIHPRVHSFSAFFSLPHPIDENNIKKPPQGNCPNTDNLSVILRL